MSDDPDAIRAEIEATRRNLSGDVDALADKVTPSKIAERQTRKVKGVFHSISERVMGSADDVSSSAGGASRMPASPSPTPDGPSSTRRRATRSRWA